MRRKLRALIALQIPETPQVLCRIDLFGCSLGPLICICESILLTDTDYENTDIQNRHK